MTQEEQDSGGQDMGGLIPEIYYDLIARVASGVPVVLAIIIPHLADQGKSLDAEKLLNFTSFLFLVGLGYVTGHFLTSVSTLLNGIIWRIFLLARDANRDLNFKFSYRSVRKIFAQIYARIDWATRRDSASGTVLKKMEAGAALTDNMLSGWVVILTYHGLGGDTIWNVDFRNWRDFVIVVLVTLILIFSVLMRRIVFVVRQDRILKLLGFSPNDVGGEHDAIDGEGTTR